MRTCIVASGSSGNCTFVSSGDTKILIDAGISYKRVVEELVGIGTDPQSIDALLITHEHGDHCSEASALSRKLNCPIYTSEGTLKRMKWYLSGWEELRSFKSGEWFSVKDLLVQSFRVFHDAIDPCGFTLDDGHVKLGLATDLGVVSDPVIRNLRDCDTVILESNHDLEMLINGGYPWYLKQRIRSEIGHLSNDAAGEALAKLAKGDRLKRAFLAHLSRSNNRPEIALGTVRKYLDDAGLDLLLSWQDRRSEVIEM